MSLLPSTEQLAYFLTHKDEKEAEDKLRITLGKPLTPEQLKEKFGFQDADQISRRFKV